MNAPRFKYVEGMQLTSWSIPARGDFNGDGQADILWQNTSTGAAQYLLMNGTTVQAYVDLEAVDIVEHRRSIDFKRGRPGGHSLAKHSNWAAQYLAHEWTTVQAYVDLGTQLTSWSIAGRATSTGTARRTFFGKQLYWRTQYLDHERHHLCRQRCFANGADIVEHRWLGRLQREGRRTFFGKTALLGERSIWIMNGTTYVGSFALPTEPTGWSSEIMITSVVGRALVWRPSCDRHAGLYWPTRHGSWCRS